MCLLCVFTKSEARNFCQICKLSVISVVSPCRSVPKDMASLPLSFYTSDFLRCHSLCCMCVLRSLVISSSVWWFSFNWWFAHICVLQLDHPLECAVAYPSDYKAGQGCWRLSPAVTALPLLRASSDLWHRSSAAQLLQPGTCAAVDCCLAQASGLGGG